MEPVFFASAAHFRRWLERNHTTATELVVGFHKKSSGKGGLTYAEAVDELLCFGWIDGVVRRIDDERYSHRVTPRRPGSIWSKVNTGHVQRLTRAGKMHPNGLAAFQAHRESQARAYSFADRPQKARVEAFDDKGAVDHRQSRKRDGGDAAHEKKRR